jgi:hypothetical protein
MLAGTKSWWHQQPDTSYRSFDIALDKFRKGQSSTTHSFSAMMNIFS